MIDPRFPVRLSHAFCDSPLSAEQVDVALDWPRGTMARILSHGLDAQALPMGQRSRLAETLGVSVEWLFDGERSAIAERVRNRIHRVLNRAPIPIAVQDDILDRLETL